MLNHQLKRWLYLTHRWVGIVTCLLFAMWFVSGLVMLYVPFPELKPSEWLAGQQPIAWSEVKIGPETVTKDHGDIRSLALEMQGGLPVWRLSGWDGSRAAYRASDGQPVARVGREEAQRIASLFGRAPAASARLIYNDQWTVPGSYDKDRPLWKVSLADSAGKVIYVSSRSGAVVLDTNRRERFWNWLGSIPHWLYPRALRELPDAWRQVVLWVSGPCIIGALAGAVIGILRLRPGRHRFSRNRMTPYRGWMKWHHVAGLIGGAFLLTWIFSGWLSVDPGRFFDRGGVSDEARQAYAGNGAIPHTDIAKLAVLAPDARRVEWVRAAGRPFVRIEAPGNADIDMDPASLRPFAAEQSDIRAGAAQLVPRAPIGSIEVLTEPDSYWYAVDDEVALPVWRIKFADRAHTWVHIDPLTGQLLGSIDARGRAYRWLYDGLHRWDFGPLLAHSPARRLLIWLLSLAGLVISVSSIWIAWRRLRRPARRPRVPLGALPDRLPKRPFTPSG
jgi:uncharacterized iron-regulated membrane protein